MQVPLIEECQKLKLKVIVTDGNQSCPCKDLADLFFQVDIFDVDQHVLLAERLQMERLQIVGVLAAGIDAPITMSAIAEHLQLPGVPRAVSELVHSKSAFRDFMDKSGFEVPRYRSFKLDELNSLEVYLDGLELPFIIKNNDSSASRGTKIFYNRDPVEERRIAEEACRWSKSKSCLVESVWVGQEVTVETIFDINGMFNPCFITDRLFDYSTGFPIEKGLRHPSNLPESTQRACYELAERVGESLGIKIGAAKFDMIIDRDGPKIIEMTTRLSGGFDCQVLVPASTGKNILKAAILTAMGHQFDADLLEDTKNLSGLTGSHWPAPGRVVSISGENEARDSAGVEYLVLRISEGDVLTGYENCADRASILIVTGENEDVARSNLSNALDLVEIVTI